MTELAPCPSCRRHVRLSETLCPFCSAGLPTRERATSAATPRARLSRAALFAAGATLMGAAACSSSSTNLDASGGASGQAGAGGTSGQAGATGNGGTTGQGGMDAGPPPTDGPIAIYSAAFPPIAGKT
jgi:hypothetical protein